MRKILGPWEQVIQPDEEVDLPLATKQGNDIPNQRRLERPPAALAASVEHFAKRFPDNELRSITTTYNCVGMVFATRRTHIHPKHVRMILDDDGYLPVASEAELKRGDLAVYVDDDDEIQHIGVVVAVTPEVHPDAPQLWNIQVLSKWGGEGEYFHDAGVPSSASTGDLGTSLSVRSYEPDCPARDD